MADTLVLCDCLGSQKVDADKLSETTGLKCSRVHTALCTRQIGDAAKLLSDGACTIACQQERATFEELAAELGVDMPGFVDIRDRAGWTDGAGDATAKMAALVADAARPVPPVRTFDVTSEGLCLVIGAPDVALPAAEQLAEALGVTVLLPPEAELPLTRPDFELVTGRLRKASGTLGNFSLTIDALAQPEPGGRGGFAPGAPRDGGKTACDIILDLSGGQPLFPASHKRDGYLRADPGDPRAVARAVFEASHMTGTFEKPFYVRLEEHLCAHSRAEKVGCTRCLDICPTGAITPAGEHVSVDPAICAGCGACAALCPSEAITYEAPAPQTLFARMHAMADVFRKAGGGAPRLMVHDAEHGREMISLAARYGRGLPAEVIPLELETISGFGHAEMLAAIASGFAAVDVLLAPRTEREALEREVALAGALLGTPRARLLDVADPDAMSEALYGAEVAGLESKPVLPLGGRRDVTRLALRSLRPGEEAPIPLPEGAPYGAVLVDTDACTLCLACAGLCPSGALGDNPDMPQLRFQEDACLQCGLCANVCPENAITLEPRMNLADTALSQVVLNEEEPFACIECGALFGVKSTIDRIVEQLEGKHPMFADSKAGRMIRMCDDCRVKAQFHSEDNPFAAGPRPKVRTSDDYLN